MTSSTPEKVIQCEKGPRIRRSRSPYPNRYCVSPWSANAVPATARMSTSRRTSRSPRSARSASGSIPREKSSPTSRRLLAGSAEAATAATRKRQ